MKFFRKGLFVVFFAVLTVILLFSPACAKNGEIKEFTAFNNTAVSVQSCNKPVSDRATDKIISLLADLNAEFSATVNGSTTYKINAAAAGENVEISPLFCEVALTCAEMRAFTYGKFDPSVYPLTLLWRFAPKYPVYDFKVPSDAEITATLATVGYGKFTFDAASATKSVSAAKLDFGGALKGYAADKIAEILKEDGVTNGYVNVGGSSLYIISADALSVIHPRKNGNILSVKLKKPDLSVSTSGDYQKNYSAGGKVYSHIIDPFTGKPQDTGVASVTVIGKNGLKLDALSTALCLCTHDFTDPARGELYAFIREILSSEEFPGAKVFAVCVNGEKKQILTNEKQGEDFTLLDKEYTVFNVEI